GKLATDLPSTLGRLIDPRHAISLVWGEISAGHAANVVPSEGILRGTLRCLDVDGWNQVAEVLPELVDRIAGPYGVEVDLEHRRGVPPVVNTEDQVTLIESAVRGELGENAVQLTPQSMGERTSPGISPTAPAPSSAWAPAPPAASPTTSTRAICSSTNAPWRSPPASSPPQRSRSSNAIVDDHGHRGPVPVVWKP